MEIRLFQKNDDIYAISRIYEQSWKFAYKGIIPQENLNSIPSEAWIEYLKRSDRHVLVLLENGEYIGTASYGQSRTVEFSDCGEVMSIYLLPQAMGRGYGKKLMKAAIDGLGNLGYRNIILWVLEENTNARAFYESIGFVSGNRTKEDNIGGKHLTEILYCYQLR